MSSVHLLPIKTAAVVFPVLALVLFAPAAVVTYRRHGIMSSWRTLSFYSFLFYALTAFFMTLIPLPSRRVDVCAEYPQMSHPALVPGNTLGDVWKEAEGRVSVGALVLHNPAVWQALLNVALLVPLGVYLRYHFQRSLLTTAAIGLGVSLFFECTQLTGVWGLYECPYRLADVDDVITNTSGALLGWWFAGPLTRWLPTLDSLDDAALARRPVPLGRRLLAFVVDMCVLPFAVLVSTLVLVPVFREDALVVGPLLVLLAYYVLLPWATGGTPGKRLLLLELAGPGDGERPAPWRLLLRAVVLAVPMLPVVGVLTAGTGFVLHVLGDRVFDAVAVAVEEPLDVLHFLATAWVPLLGAVAVVAASGLLLLVFCVALYRHPRHYGVHELLSGVHNVALPHKRALRSAQGPETPEEGTPTETASSTPSQ